MALTSINLFSLPRALMESVQPTPLNIYIKAIVNAGRPKEPYGGGGAWRGDRGEGSEGTGMEAITVVVGVLLEAGEP